MKHIRGINEASIQLKKLSELNGNWSGRNTGKGQTGDVNLALGARVLDFLDNHNLTIEVDEANGYSPISLLGNEKKLTEYRCEIKMRSDLIDYEETYKYDNNIADEDELTPEQREDMMSSYGTAFEEFNDNIGYSVFLDSNFPHSRLNEAGAAEGLEYLKMFNKCFSEDVTGGRIDDDSLAHNVEGFKKYLTYTNLKITNSNVEIVNDINYRIYKDGKFFSIAHSEIDNYNTILQGLLKMK